MHSCLCVCPRIMSAGGTGFGPRDVTPEAVRPLLHREAPAVAQALINEGQLRTARWATASILALLACLPVVLLCALCHSQAPAAVFVCYMCVCVCVCVCGRLEAHTPRGAVSPSGGHSRGDAYLHASRQVCMLWSHGVITCVTRRLDSSHRQSCDASVCLFVCLFLLAV